MGVVIVSVLGLFSRLLASVSKSADVSAGLQFAQRRMDEAARDGPPNWGQINAATLGIYSHDVATKTSFYSTITPVAMSTAPMGDLYRVEVQVFWWPEDAANPVAGVRQGVGKQFVHLDRLIYVENKKY